MGCGASSGGKSKSFKPKKGGKCLAPCPMDNGIGHTAVVMEEVKKDGNSTYTVYFPEYEPNLDFLPRSASKEDMAKYKQEKIQAVKNMIPGMGKKTTKTEGLTADQLKKNPFPTKLEIGTFKAVGIPQLDDIFNPAGAIVDFIKSSNNIIYTCWNEIFKLENKYDIHFVTLLKATSGSFDLTNPDAAALDSCDVPFKKEVALACIKMLLAAMNLAKSIPPLIEEIAPLVDSSIELTKDESADGGSSTTDKLKGMCDEAELAALEKMKAVKNALTNLLTLKAIPGALKALAETGSFTVKTIMKACTDADEKKDEKKEEEKKDC